MITKAMVMDYVRPQFDLFTLKPRERRDVAMMAAERFVWPQVENAAATAEEDDDAFWSQVGLVARQANVRLSEFEEEARLEALEKVRELVRAGAL